MAKHPVVNKAQVSKGLLGSWKIQFDCPACDGKLTTKPDTIGAVDDCPLCGAQFVVSESVRDHIDQIEADEESRKVEAAEQRRLSALKKQTAARNEKISRQEQLASQQREKHEHDDSRGYEYPKLKQYQTNLEWFAIIGAVLLCIAALVPGGFGIAQQLSGSHTAAGAGFIGTVVCLLWAASWYGSLMIAAEIIRLVVTVALDVRQIRDRLKESEY